MPLRLPDRASDLSMDTLSAGPELRNAGQFLSGVKRELKDPCTTRPAIAGGKATQRFCRSVVPQARLERALRYRKQILSLPRLPIPPLGHIQKVGGS